MKVTVKHSLPGILRLHYQRAEISVRQAVLSQTLIAIQGVHLKVLRPFLTIPQRPITYNLNSRKPNVSRISGDVLDARFKPSIKSSKLKNIILELKWKISYYSCEVIYDNER